jgi:hypothetical protein
MDHQHVRIQINDAQTPGHEHVPARPLGGSRWQLLRSPLYATGVAARDVVMVTDPTSGAFEIVERGGNVCVQLYLGPRNADDAHATASLADSIKSEIEPWGGVVDGMTPGLISCTVPMAVGFPNIERVFARITGQSEGAQWQFANVYDTTTGEPLGWWNG